jgi:hypothetical protein
VIPAAKEIRREVRVETTPEPRPEPKPELKRELEPEYKPEPEARPESRPDTQVETMTGPTPLDMALPAPAVAETTANAAPIAPIQVPDDPGPEPEAPEPQARPAPNAGRGLLSWFSRNAAG